MMEIITVLRQDKMITLKTTGAVYRQLLTCALPQIQRSDTLPHLGVWQDEMKELKIISSQELVITVDRFTF